MSYSFFSSQIINQTKAGKEEIFWQEMQMDL